MTTLIAHFDGRVLVPEKPVALPRDCPLEVRVSPLKAGATGHRPLAALATLAGQFLPILIRRAMRRRNTTINYTTPQEDMILLDTSYLIALFDARDGLHARAMAGPKP